jgi:hypothetical protein
MIRNVSDDEKWRSILRGIQSRFRHQTVTGQQIEDYMIQASGLNLAPIFQQYLTTPKVPVLEYKQTPDGTAYRWAEVVPGFAMPVRANGVLLHPTEAWKTMPRADTIVADPNFYVLTLDATGDWGAIRFVCAGGPASGRWAIF